MVVPERPRPAQELTASPSTVPEYYLQYLRKREGELCTTEELSKLHPTIPQARTNRLKSFRELILDIRSKHLGQREGIITLVSYKGKPHGYYYFDGQAQEATGLSEIGVSLFQDDSNGLVIPELSVLSKKIKQNPLIKDDDFVALFDRLSPRDNLNRQRSYLIPHERRIMVLLAEHPEGVSTEEFLRKGIGINFPDLTRDQEIIRSRLSSLRRKIKGNFRICCLPSPRKPGEKREYGERRYFLKSKNRVGEQILIPPEDREIFYSLPAPVKETVEELCNRFIIGQELKYSLGTPQRRLLYFLASRFDYPCSMSKLAEAVYPSAELARYPLGALGLAKVGLQKNLENSKFEIITIISSYEAPDLPPVEGAYLLGHRGHYQEKKMEIPFFSGEFSNVDARIRQKIRRMCHLTVAERNKEGELLHRRPVITFRERRIFLALARSFPEGCQIQVLASRLLPEVENGYRRVVNTVCTLKKKIEGDFYDLGISIVYEKRSNQYRLVL